MPTSQTHQTPLVSARGVGSWLSFSHPAKGEKLSGISHECVRHPLRVRISCVINRREFLALSAAPLLQADPRPNVVFILADDLGYGDLGCYGQQQMATPNIDRIATEGVRFTQAYAGSTVCAPSRCALMTGMHTGHGRIPGNARLSLFPEDRTVPETFHQ